MLSIFTISPGNFFTAKKPIRSVADIQGLKLRSPGRVSTQILEALGGIPILKSSTEAYELLSTGVIDGSLMAKESVQSTNSMDLLHHGTLIPGGLYNAVLSVVINQDRWSELSEADRQAIQALSADTLAAKFGQAYFEVDQASVDAMMAAKYEFISADGPFLEELKAKLEPIRAGWSELARSKGIPDPDAVIEDLQREQRSSK